MEHLQEQSLFFPEPREEKNPYQIIMFIMGISNFYITTYNCLIVRNSAD